MNLKTVKNSPEFKDKIQIAIGLFDNTIESLDISGITFDTWYASTKYLEHIHRKEKFFFSEIKSNRNIFTYHPVKKTHCVVKPDELVTLTKKHYWHKINMLHAKHSFHGELFLPGNPATIFLQIGFRPLVLRPTLSRGLP